MEGILKNNNMTQKVSTKKNLRRNFENTFNKKLIFVNIDRLLYLYPNIFLLYFLLFNVYKV